MKKRIVTLLTALTVLAGSLIGSPAFAAAEFTNKDIQLTVANSHAGDVFYGKNPSFHLTVTNPTNEPVTANVSSVAKNVAGVSEWGRVLAFGAEANSGAHGVEKEINVTEGIVNIS